ncbi:hypothetical protein Leryth_015074 [Lithospermum erythrorhizon]|nr:hypothetical protein Leryth_015074 [Lithospermum erythrorhizon]
MKGNKWRNELQLHSLKRLLCRILLQFPNWCFVKPKKVNEVVQLCTYTYLLKGNIAMRSGNWINNNIIKLTSGEAAPLSRYLQKAQRLIR